MSENISKSVFGGYFFHPHSTANFCHNEPSFTEGVTKHLGLGYFLLGHGIEICRKRGSQFLQCTDIVQVRWETLQLQCIVTNIIRDMNTNNYMRIGRFLNGFV